MVCFPNRIFFIIWKVILGAKVVKIFDIYKCFAINRAFGAILVRHLAITWQE